MVALPALALTLTGVRPSIADRRMGAIVLGATLILFIGLAGHSGGTDANGCHMDRKAGTRHCHGPKQRSAAPPVRRSSGAVYYPNCAAARAAGAAPVRIGTRGYGRHLDRDGDGVGCE